MNTHAPSHTHTQHTRTPTHTKTQTDRQTDRGTHGHTDTHTAWSRSRHWKYTQTVIQSHSHRATKPDARCQMPDEQIDRHTGTQTQKHREREIDKHIQTKAQSHSHRATQPDKHTQAHIATEPPNQMPDARCQMNTLTDTQGHRHTDTETRRHTHTHTHTHTHRERERNRQTHTDKGTNTQPVCEQPNK